MEKRSVPLFPDLRILNYSTCFRESEKILQPSLLIASPPSQWVNNLAPFHLEKGTGRSGRGCASANLLTRLGLEDSGVPLPFCPATAGAQRERAVPDCPGWVPGPPRGPTFPGSPGRAAALGGFRGPSHVLAQRSASSVPSRAARWALSRTGFVIASRPFPPSASPTSAGPPSAPPPRRGASPGTHTGVPRAGAPHQLPPDASMPEQSRVPSLWKT